MVVAFEITINNETKIVVGIEEVSVLSYKKGEENKANNVDLRVGDLLHHGKHDYEHLD